MFFGSEVSVMWYVVMVVTKEVVFVGWEKEEAVAEAKRLARHYGRAMSLRYAAVEEV